jgi:glucokinase
MIVTKDGRSCGCGQRGCVEAYSSAANTALRLSEAIAHKNSNAASPSPGEKENEYAFIDEEGNEVSGARGVFEKAAKGESLAIAVLEETVEYLAVLCINICRTVDPAVIIIGGGMAMAGDKLIESIKKHIGLKAWTVLPTDIDLRIARGVEHGGILGAALAVERKLLAKKNVNDSILTSLLTGIMGAHRTDLNSDITIGVAFLGFLLGSISSWAYFNRNKTT